MNKRYENISIEECLKKHKSGKAIIIEKGVVVGFKKEVQEK